MGERTKKELPETGTTIHYLYNEQGLIGEYDDSGRLIQEYGWKPQGLWSTDPLFTRNGAITWQDRSNSYGQTTINDKSTLTSNLRLPGQYYESETGLYYNWFRYYDPNLGRYLRNDPTGLYGGLNAYAYGLSNPLTYIDNNGQLVNFALQAVWWGLRQAGAAYIRCFGQCLVASAAEASIGVLWQYMMGGCEPGFEFSGMAVLAMQSCGYSCLNPRNWGGKRAKASAKAKAYEARGDQGHGANRIANGSVQFKQWKKGGAIDKPMAYGSSPNWNVVRTKYWKNRAATSAGEFSKENIARMRKGKALLDYNPRTGQYESRELHHVVPQRAGDGNDPLNLRELMPEQHGAVDPFRHTVTTTSGIR